MSYKSAPSTVFPNWIFPSEKLARKRWPHPAERSHLARVRPAVGRASNKLHVCDTSRWNARHSVRGEMLLYWSVSGFSRLPWPSPPPLQNMSVRFLFYRSQTDTAIVRISTCSCLSKRATLHTRLDIIVKLDLMHITTCVTTFVNETFVPHLHNRPRVY